MWHWSCIHLRHLWKFVTKSEGGGENREATFLGPLLRPKRTQKHVFLLHLFLAVLGLCCCTGSSLVVLNGGYSSCSAQASHCGGFSCWGARALASSWALEHRFTNCGACAQWVCSMSDLPDPGIEPMPPALAGGFFTSEPPGKPQEHVLISSLKYHPLPAPHLPDPLPSVLPWLLPGGISQDLQLLWQITPPSLGRASTALAKPCWG